MFKTVVRFAMLLVAVLLMIVVPVMAHEGREVGDYLLSFGWREEPAYAGMMNGPEVFISLHDTEEAVNESVAVSLQAEVSFGDQTITVNLRPALSSDGHYIAELVPTLPGDYTFRIFGMIDETEVDELFSSADGEFSTVEPAADILFPAVDNVDTRIAALEEKIAALEAKLEELDGQ